MNIAIDISPLQTGNFIQHKVRGSGFYLENLRTSLEKYIPSNSYIYFVRGEKLPETIDVIHYPYFEPFFRTLPKKSNLLSIVTIHDLIPLVFSDKFPAGIKGKLKWHLQKRAVASVDAVITDSESSKRDIHTILGIPMERIHVVYLAPGEAFTKRTYTKQEVDTLNKKYHLPNKFALYVGDVTWNKNIPNLIRAIKNTTIPLVMVGKTLASSEYDRKHPWNSDLFLSQSLVRDNPQFYLLGFLPPDDLVAIYNMASVFVMPSRYEGFGLPILEAMSCGCPVITTRNGSLKEVAGDAAEFVDAEDVENISQTIENVVNNGKRQELLRQKGFNQAKKFSWKKTAQETAAVYISVAKKKYA